MKINVRRLNNGSWAVIKPAGHVEDCGCIPEYTMLSHEIAFEVAAALAAKPARCRDPFLVERCTGIVEHRHEQAREQKELRDAMSTMSLGEAFMRAAIGRPLFSLGFEIESPWHHSPLGGTLGHEPTLIEWDEPVPFAPTGKVIRDDDAPSEGTTAFPDPEEVLQRFDLLPHGDKIDCIRKWLDCSDRAGRCFMEDHESLKDEVEGLRRKVAVFQATHNHSWHVERDDETTVCVPACACGLPYQGTRAELHALVAEFAEQERRG